MVASLSIGTQVHAEGSTSLEQGKKITEDFKADFNSAWKNADSLSDETGVTN